MLTGVFVEIVEAGAELLCICCFAIDRSASIPYLSIIDCICGSLPAESD